VGIADVVVSLSNLSKCYSISRNPFLSDRMVIFSVALLLFCFTISNTSTRIATGTMSAVVAALVAWCIRTAWESGDTRGVRQDSLLTLRREGDRLFARLKHFVLVLIPFRPFPTRRASEDVHSVHSMVDRQPEGGVGGV
jgi:hypothetical protein